MTAMVDLSNLQQVNFGNGVTGNYDPNSGTYYDAGGNVLSASDLSQYGAFTIGSPGASGSPPGSSPGSVPISGSGSGAALSGLGGLFSSVATSIVNATRPPTVSTPQGTLVYNPATGGYTTQSAITTSAALNPLVLLLLGAVVLWLVMREA